jgi:hypothetical protein
MARVRQTLLLGAAHAVARNDVGTDHGAHRRGVQTGPTVELAAYTIKEFCAAHRIHHDTYYRLQRAGCGPEIMKVGGKTLISVEAAKAWREAAARETRRTRKADEETTTTA